MYAVIKTGGKQYRVAAGDKIKVEQIAADEGKEITIDQVLAVGDGDSLKVGTAHFQNAPSQALSKTSRSSPAFHRAGNCLY